jgi:hypothetical protein
MAKKGDRPMDKKADTNRVEFELLAMRLVIEALSELPDHSARARVLRWAADHMGLPQVSTPAAPEADSSSSEMPAPVAVTAETADLAFEDLESLFEAAPAASGGTPDRPAAAEGEPTASKSRGLVTDFKRPALDHQRA